MKMALNKILKYPLSTEKSLRLLEAENKILFIVDINATRKQVKNAFEKEFKVKVDKVNLVITPKGLKKAYIKLAPEHPALDIATQLGLM